MDNAFNGVLATIFLVCLLIGSCAIGDDQIRSRVAKEQIIYVKDQAFKCEKVK